MFERPADLDDASVVESLVAHWGIAVPNAVYAPLGFGSHHWLAGDYFVSVDQADDKPVLQSALKVAHDLRTKAGLDFVIAPIPTAAGQLVAPLTNAWVMHVYERLDVVDDTAHGPHDNPDVVELVRRIHDATPTVERHARREDFSIDDRDDLEEALGELGESWETGPFGDRCRQALQVNEDSVRFALARHDDWARDVPTGNWVVTHGEPHRGNVFRTTKGWAVVDWDTALLAPAERDWWDMPNGPGDPALRELYRLRWSLMEIAGYVSLFFAAHDDDRNTGESWKNFEHYLAAIR